MHLTDKQEEINVSQSKAQLINDSGTQKNSQKYIQFERCKTTAFRKKLTAPATNSRALSQSLTLFDDAISRTSAPAPFPVSDDDGVNVRLTHKNSDELYITIFFHVFR